MDAQIRLQVSAISFNIHGFCNQFWTGWHKERTTGKLFRNNKDDCRFDFALLQEAWDPTTSRIVAASAGYKNGVHTQRPNPSQISIYGNGLATLTDWQIVDKGHEEWLHYNKHQYEGGFGAWKGFSWIRVQHNKYKYARLVIYNLHGTAGDIKKVGTERLVAENLVQLGKHIVAYAADDAVMVGGDFNWRHRLRAPDMRPHDGPIDAKYNAYFANAPDVVRYDALDDMRKAAGGDLHDAAWLLVGTHDHFAGVDKFFVKNGKDVSIRVLDLPYLGSNTPFHGLSDHHPLAMYFELTFQKGYNNTI
jgi:hypothetical protein